MLDREQQARVKAETSRFIRFASGFMRCHIPEIRVSFDLSGAAAGQYRVRNGQPEIRYNPYIFACYFADNLSQTVPHEVAHYIADFVYGAANTRPHGEEWRQIMMVFGAPAKTTHSYNLSGIPCRRERRHIYRCRCSDHSLSSRRHRSVQRGKARYVCRLCGSELTIKPLSGVRYA